MNEDPILDNILDNAPQGMFGDEQEPTPQGAYGEGIWKGRKLVDVVSYPKSDKGFGYRIGLKTFLKGDDQLEYTLKLDLERTLVSNGHDIEDWQENREAKKRGMLNEALRAVGFNRPVTQPIDTEEQYQALINVFAQKVGATFDCKIVADGKNKFVVGEGEQTNREGQKGTWTFEPNGYTRVAWIKPARKPKA